MRKFVFAVLFAAVSLSASAQVHVRAAANGNGHEHTDPSAAATEPNADYPLKLHIIKTARHQSKYDETTEGSGNLLGDPMIGFDYKAMCLLLHNDHADEFFQGKWKKQDKRIEILIQKPGETKVDHCTLDVAMKSAPYGKDNPAPDAPNMKK